MTIRYYLKGDYWYNVDTMEIDGKPGMFHTAAPKQKDGGMYIISDIPPYKSPVNGKIVDGRYARREDLKRSGCREVDPCEIRQGYSEDFARRKGLAMPEKEFRHLNR